MSDPANNRNISSISSSASSVSAEMSASAAAVRMRQDGTSLSALREWVRNHDERWLFIILYVGLAVVLSVWISLFWLVAVVGAHFALELVRQRQLHGEGGGGVLLEALWEIKLDIALVLFALALTLYMSVVLGIVGLQSAARIGAASRAAARFGAWERTLRGVLLSADDAAQVARAVALRRQRGRGAMPAAAQVVVEEEPQPRHPRWGSWAGKWGTGDWIAMGLAALCVLLIVAAPRLTEHTYASALATMLHEMRPLP